MERTASRSAICRVGVQRRDFANLEGRRSGEGHLPHWRVFEGFPSPAPRLLVEPHPAALGEDRQIPDLGWRRSAV